MPNSFHIFSIFLYFVVYWFPKLSSNKPVNTPRHPAVTSVKPVKKYILSIRHYQTKKYEVLSVVDH